jgi:(p)ppGpp synthase/HD superfamily hydrolase
VNGGRRFQDLMARLPRTRAALDYAEGQHAGQRRKVDGAPFIEHPVEVASLLYYAGAADDVIAAGVLHDTIEKTSTEEADLRERFGSHVAALVSAVSEDETISRYQPRKAALRRQVAAAGPDALMVFAADKVSKARELRRELEPADGPRSISTAATSRRRRLAHYQQSLALLERLLADSPLVALLRAELEKLSALPAPLTADAV